MRRRARAPGGPEVVAEARLQVEYIDVHFGRCARAPGGAAMGANAQLPVARRYLRSRSP